MKVDNKQFLICPQRVEREGFLCLPLPHRRFLSYEFHLEVSTLDNGMILLGEAIPLIPDAPERLCALEEESDISAVASVMQYYSGRWVLIFGNNIISDACALMSLYYSDDVVSSSLNLIYRHTGHNRIDTTCPRPVYGDLVDWVITPGTRLEGVHHMLCSQYLEWLPGIGYRSRHYDFVAPVPNVTTGIVINTLIDCYDRFFRAAEKKYSSLVLPLTAGADSRTLFALMIHSGVRFSTVTFDRDAMDRSDHKTAERISFICDVPYNFIKSGVVNESLRVLWDEHTFESCASEDENFIVRGQFSAIPDSALLVRGNVWEIATCAWWRRLGNNGDVRNAVSRSMPQMKGPFFETWLNDFLSNNRLLDWRDTLFMEQRESAWLGSIEQALDLLPFSHLAPVNSAYILSLMVSLPLEERQDKLFQKRLINRILPQVSDIPYNSRSLGEWFYHYADQGIKLLCRKIKITSK